MSPSASLISSSSVVSGRCSRRLYKMVAPGRFDEVRRALSASMRDKFDSIPSASNCGHANDALAPYVSYRPDAATSIAGQSLAERMNIFPENDYNATGSSTAAYTHIFIHTWLPLRVLQMPHRLGWEWTRPPILLVQKRPRRSVRPDVHEAAAAAGAAGSLLRPRSRHTCCRRDTWPSRPPG